MSGGRLLALAALAALAAPCLGACEGMLPEPDFNRMIAQRNYRAFTEAPQFPDGRAMRPPPAGTVSRDRVIGHPELTDGVADGRYVDRIPLPVSREVLERGRTRFDIFCAACHGARGDGVSPVAEVMVLRKPPSLLAPPVTQFPPGRVFSVVSLGYGLMRSYASELPVADRWAIVAYLQALQLSQGVALDALPADVRAEAQGVLR
jgi:hypothetical protein